MCVRRLNRLLYLTTQYRIHTARYKGFWQDFPQNFILKVVLFYSIFEERKGLVVSFAWVKGLKTNPPAYRPTLWIQDGPLSALKHILILVRFQYLFDDCHWNLYNACHLIANNFSFVLAAQTSVLLNCLNFVIVFKGVGLYCLSNISLFSRYFNELAFLRADVRLMPLGNSGKEPSRLLSIKLMLKLWSWPWKAEINNLLKKLWVAPCFYNIWVENFKGITLYSTNPSHCHEYSLVLDRKNPKPGKP